MSAQRWPVLILRKFWLASPCKKYLLFLKKLTWPFANPSQLKSLLQVLVSPHACETPLCANCRKAKFPTASTVNIKMEARMKLIPNVMWSQPRNTCFRLDCTSGLGTSGLWRQRGGFPGNLRPARGRQGTQRRDGGIPPGFPWNSPEGYPTACCDGQGTRHRGDAYVSTGHTPGYTPGTPFGRTVFYLRDTPLHAVMARAPDIVEMHMWVLDIPQGSPCSSVWGCFWDTPSYIVMARSLDIVEMLMWVLDIP